MSNEADEPEDADDETGAPDWGEKGELGPLTPSLNPGGQTSDTRMIRRAIRLGWDIPSKFREPIIKRLLLIALGDDKSGKVVSDRERISALKALIAANGQNVRLQEMINDMVRGTQDPATTGAIAGATAGLMANALKNATADELLRLRELVAKMQGRAAAPAELPPKKIEIAKPDPPARPDSAGPSDPPSLNGQH